MKDAPAQPNQSLMEGIHVLLALVQREESVGVRELARELGMTPTRLQRYAATLAHLGLATQGPDRRYAPGPGVHALSAMTLSASGLAVRALEQLPALNDLGAIVALGVLWRRTVSYLYFSHPGTPTASKLGRAKNWPAQDSVIGLLMLAHASEGVLEREFPQEVSVLRPLVQQVRSEGFARRVDADGSVSLAVPVGMPPIAGLAVSGLRAGISEQDVLERLTQAAARLRGGDQMKKK